MSAALSIAAAQPIYARPLQPEVTGKLVVSNTPKWKLITSHTARRTFTTVNVMRGYNIHTIKKATGHTDLRSLDKYVCDE